MTREEAIEQLQICKDLIKQDGQDYLDERDVPILDMAIEALKADVVRWSSWNKTFEQSGIADLISRADAIEAICGECIHNDECVWRDGTFCKEINAINALPSAYAVSREDGIPCPICNGKGVIKRSLDVNANVVEVVRCKDCRYYNNDYMGKWCGRHQAPVWVKEDDFCSHGERREE